MNIAARVAARWLAGFDTQVTFKAAPGGDLIGYKVMNYDTTTHQVVSGANSTIRMPLRVGMVHRMPGAGIFLGNDPQYVLDNYAVHDVNFDQVFLRSEGLEVRKLDGP
jgi:hypothetical protein